ncbi:hypothetical protein ONZ45_g8196 [Pleurotus djamor]|nr:hypothetical protein ONZ45_g8196 [Pleurotus djamor]
MTTTAKSTPPTQSAAIFKLPDDILLLIFLCGHAQSEEYDEYDYDDYDDINELTPDYATLASSEHGRTLTSVCQRWRQLALSVTQLWTRISLDKPKYGAELIERTKEAPLDVCCLFPSPTPEAFWEGVSKLLPQCMERMSDLRIVLQKHHNDARFWSLLSRPQALKRLTITGSGYPDGGVPHSLSQSVPLDKMSSLCSLILDAVCLQQDLPSIPTLRWLILRDNSDEYISGSDPLRNENLSIEWLLRSLPNIPNVEYVDAAVVSVGLLPAAQRPRLCRLPKLRFLKLFCTDVTSTMIFEFLDLSPTIALDIMFDYTSPIHLRTDGMAALLARYERNPSANICLAVRTDICVEEGTQCITLLLTEDEVDCPTLLATSFWREMFSEYVSLLPLERLHTLEYVVYASGDQGGPTDLWIEVIAMCPNLRKLTVKANAGIHFLRAYTERYARLRNPEDSTVNPQLCYLSFKKVKFEAEGGATKAYDVMLESLGELRAANFPIELIFLDRCNISEASVTKLRERIQVEWDENERGMTVVPKDLGEYHF